VIQQLAIEVEFINETVTLLGHIIMFGGILFRVSYKQPVTEHLDIERREPRRYFVVGETDCSPV
jgi:hypothetical protein